MSECDLPLDSVELQMKTMMTSSIDETDYFFHLCDDPIRFEPTSAINNVFYDECGKQVCLARFMSQLSMNNPWFKH